MTAHERPRAASGADRRLRLGPEHARQAHRRAERSRAPRGPGRRVDHARREPARARAARRRAAARRSGTGPGRSGGCRRARPRRGARGRSRPARKPSLCSASARRRGEPLGAEQQAQRRRARRGRSARGAGAAARSRSARRPRPASRWRSGRRSRPRSPTWPRARRPRPTANARHHVVLLAPAAAGRASARPGSRAARRRAGVRTRRWRRAPASSSDSGDQRADDERLAPGAQLLADPVIGARSLALGRAHERLDRLAAARELAQHGEVEVAVVARARACAGSASRSCAARAGSLAGRAPWRQRGPLADAEAVLLVDDRDRQRARTGPDPRSARGCRPAATARRCASLPSRSARRRVRASSRSAARSRTASPGISAWIVAKCCSASGSVGAISAALVARARRRAAARTGRRPSCPSRPLPSAGAASAARARGRASIAVDRRELVAGEGEREHLGQPAGGQLALAVERRRGAPRSAQPAAAQQRQLDQQQLLERQPAPAQRLLARRPSKCDRGQRAARARAAAPRRAAAPGSGSGTSRDRGARARGPAPGSESRTGPRWPGSAPPRRSPVRGLGVRAWPWTRKRLRASNLPCSTRRVPAG